MTKKTATMVTVILLLAFAVFSFMPCIINEVSMEASGYGYIESWSSLENMYRTVNLHTEAWGINVSGNFAIVTILLDLIGLGTFVMRMKNEQGKKIKYLSYAPVVAFVSFVIMSTLIFMSDTSNPFEWEEYYLKWDMGWGFYILFVLLAVAAYLSVLLINEKLEDVPKTSVKNVSVVTTANELEKFKELLDKGVITPEEFDAKKKRLLEL